MLISAHKCPTKNIGSNFFTNVENQKKSCIIHLQSKLYKTAKFMFCDKIGKSEKNPEKAESENNQRRRQMKKEERLDLIRKDLQKSKEILNSLCDENRQKILLVLLENCASGGIRVGDIAEKVNLSRPAVSHHLKNMIENKIVSIEHVGTKNYYHITGTAKILSLKSLLQNVELYIEETSLNQF